MENKTKTAKERVKFELTIEEFENGFISVLNKTYDYIDTGYYTTDCKRQQIFSKEYLEEQIESLQNSVNNSRDNIDKNEELLKQCQTFMKYVKNKGFEKVLTFLKIEENLSGYIEQQKDFIIEHDTAKRFLDHFIEMKKQWDAKDAKSN